MTREDIPTEFGDREDLTTAGEKLQRAFKEQLTRARMMEDGMICDFYCVYKIIIILNAKAEYTFQKILKLLTCIIFMHPDVKQNMTKRSRI
jgi:hypothetical protein